jgi:hypothetical protein
MSVSPRRAKHSCVADRELLWSDGSTFDLANAFRHYPLGVRRKAADIWPTLVARLDTEERLAAHGAGQIGTSLRCFWMATDQAVHLFATPLYRETLLEHNRLDYAAITRCSLHISRLPFLIKRLGTLRIACATKTGAQEAIPGKQADALHAVLATTLPPRVYSGAAKKVAKPS